MGFGHYTSLLDTDYIGHCSAWGSRRTEHQMAPGWADVSGKKSEAKASSGVAFNGGGFGAGSRRDRGRGGLCADRHPTEFRAGRLTLPVAHVGGQFRTFCGRPRQAAGRRLASSPASTKTRETVWIPKWMKHANGAKRLGRVWIVSTEAGQGTRAFFRR